MDRALISQQAELMIALADEASLGPPPSESLGDFSVADAYAVALEVMHRRQASGWKRVGRKLGFTNTSIWPQYGVEQPMFGYMYDRTVFESPGEGGMLPLTGLSQPLIEPEIFFQFGQAPPLTDDPEELLRCIEWMGHGFEIVQCHFPDWKFRIEDTIADGGLHGRYLVGPKMRFTDHSEPQLADRLAQFQITLLKDGVEVRRGGGDLVLASPLKALANFLDVLATLPGHPPVEAGEIVTTGTLVDSMSVEPGQTWSTRIDGVELPGFEALLT